MATFITRAFSHLLWMTLGVAQASVTAAWKMPMTSIAPNHPADDRIRKLEKPPGESAFFQPGDELWDISKTLEPEIQPDGEGEWAVWNARTGMVVVRGTQHDVIAADHALGNSRNPWLLQSRFELVDESLTVKNEKVRTVSIISNNKAKSSFKTEDLSADFEFTMVEPEISSTGIFWLALTARWPDGNPSSEWELKSALNLSEGHRIRLARQGPDSKAKELHVTLQRVLRDGSPFADARWIEKDGKAERWTHPRSNEAIARHKIGEEREIAWYQVPEDFPERLGGGEAEPAWRDVQVPEAMRKWVSGNLKNASTSLRENGVRLDTPEAFAGYDPQLSLLVVSTNSVNLDLLESIIFPSCILLTKSAWIEARDDREAWALACGMGEKGSLSRLAGAEKRTDFLLEATPSPKEAGIELQYSLDSASEAGKRFQLQATTKLIPGTPQVVEQAKSGEAGEDKISISAQNLELWPPNP